MTNDVTRTYPVRQGDGAVLASNELSQALNEWLERNGPPGLFRTCATCKNMERGGPAVCNLYRCPPPVDVIMRGCDSYVDETDIPF